MAADSESVVERTGSVDNKDSEVCRHWLRGFCLYGDKCRATHPADRLGEQRGVRQVRNNGRLKVRNNSKTLILRRFLLETFGRDYLRSGSGVIDVAGGKGQLSFELLNLNLVPSTVWDPRELDIREYEKRLKLGMYHRNEIWTPWLDTPDPSKSDNPVALQPGHVRMFFDEPMIAALAPKGRPLPKEYQPSYRTRKRQRLASGEAAPSPQPPVDEPDADDADDQGQKFAELYAKTAGVVNQIRWSKKGLIYDKNNVSLATVADKHHLYVKVGGTASAASASTLFSQIESETTAGSAASSSSTDSASLSATHSPPSPSIESASTHSPSSPSIESASTHSPSLSSNSTPLASCSSPHAPAAPCSPSISTDGELEAHGDHRQPWWEVRDTLLNASVIVGLHPDQACGAIVDFALLHNKPFVVLPCCVYWKQFGKRHLPGPPLRQVRTYEDLCQWIMNKDPRIKRIEMPFEGKNTLMYWLPEGLHVPDAFQPCPFPEGYDDDDDI